MKDFFKICTIYAVMWVMMYVFQNRFESTGINILVYFVIQNATLVYLFKVFRLQSIDVMIFCGLLIVIFILMALDYNVIFIEAAEISNNIKGILPLQIIQIANCIGKPFFSIFLILKNINLMNYSIYIIPSYIALLAYISVKEVNN